MNTIPPPYRPGTKIYVEALDYYWIGIFLCMDGDNFVLAEPTLVWDTGLYHKTMAEGLHNAVPKHSTPLTPGERCARPWRSSWHHNLWRSITSSQDTPPMIEEKSETVTVYPVLSRQWPPGLPAVACDFPHEADAPYAVDDYVYLETATKYWVGKVCRWAAGGLYLKEMFCIFNTGRYHLTMHGGFRQDNLYAEYQRAGAPDVEWRVATEQILVSRPWSPDMMPDQDAKT